MSGFTAVFTFHTVVLSSIIRKPFAIQDAKGFRAAIYRSMTAEAGHLFQVQGKEAADRSRANLIHNGEKYAKLTAERKTLNQRYLTLKEEVKEAEKIRKSVYSILRQFYTLTNNSSGSTPLFLFLNAEISEAQNEIHLPIYSRISFHLYISKSSLLQ